MRSVLAGGAQPLAESGECSRCAFTYYDANNQVLDAGGVDIHAALPARRRVRARSRSCS